MKVILNPAKYTIFGNLNNLTNQETKGFWKEHNSQSKSVPIR